MPDQAIYISGGMSGAPDHNFPAFYAAEERLAPEWRRVLNPARRGVIKGAEWQDYLRFDIAQLVGAEAIYMLPGWEKSRGACLELHIAQELGMRVLYAEGAEPTDERLTFSQRLAYAMEHEGD